MTMSVLQNGNPCRGRTWKLVQSEFNLGRTLFLYVPWLILDGKTFILSILRRDMVTGPSRLYNNADDPAWAEKRGYVCSADRKWARSRPWLTVSQARISKRTREKTHHPAIDRLATKEEKRQAATWVCHLITTRASASRRQKRDPWDQRQSGLSLFCSFPILNDEVAARKKKRPTDWCCS